MPRVTPEDLHVMWWEDEQGNVIKALEFVEDGPEAPPPGAATMHVRLVTELREHLYAVLEDGGTKEIGVGSSSYNEDLVLALAYASNGLSLHQAIIVAASSCERCMNALAHQAGLEWGYPEFGEEWQQSNTECRFCLPPPALARDRWREGTRVRAVAAWRRDDSEAAESVVAGAEAEIVAARSRVDASGNFTHHVYGLRMNPDDEREEGDLGKLIHWVPEGALEVVAMDAGHAAGHAAAHARERQGVPREQASPVDREHGTPGKAGAGE